ncbi:MAG TPA: response regulator [Dehalococcoidia bacterium]|nr:response regulator [Dehalococcoidia bacterium]
MKTILVVDDEPVIRSLASASLERDGWRVVPAADAASALAEIERAPPDLIFLDLGLPGMAGEDLARRLRADRRTASIPIVYLTGRRLEAADEADAVLTKPFTPAALRAFAANWL